MLILSLLFLFCLLCADKILEENRQHQLGPDPTPKLRENIGAQIYRIKKCIAYMSEGKSKLSDFCFLNETGIHE